MLPGADINMSAVTKLGSILEKIWTIVSPIIGTYDNHRQPQYGEEGREENSKIILLLLPVTWDSGLELRQTPLRQGGLQAVLHLRGNIDHCPSEHNNF